MKRLLVILMVVALGGAWAAAAQAGSTLTFALAPGFGTIEWPPDPIHLTVPLQGIDLAVASITDGINLYPLPPFDSTSPPAPLPAPMPPTGYLRAGAPFRSFSLFNQATLSWKFLC
jgi:hypothetical protein